MALAPLPSSAACASGWESVIRCGGVHRGCKLSSALVHLPVHPTRHPPILACSHPSGPCVWALAEHTDRTIRQVVCPWCSVCCVVVHSAVWQSGRPACSPMP